MIVSVLGSGNGGTAAVVDLIQRGFTARLWGRSVNSLKPYLDISGINYKGVLGEGVVTPELISTDLRKITEGVDAILVCLPTLAHGDIANALAKSGLNRIPVVLNPGHTGGALEFCHVFRSAGLTPPPTAEFSTLTYVARKSNADTISISGVAQRVWVAALHNGSEAIEIAQHLYPCAVRTKDVLATGLANVNMVLHPPGAVLGASWIESTGGDFTFYVDGLPDCVGRVMELLDKERLAVASAFGHQLPDLYNEMQAIGTIEPDTDSRHGIAAAVRGGKANQKIKAPDSLRHRYYKEDFWYGLTPFLVFAKIAGVDVPVADSLMILANGLVAGSDRIQGRTAHTMGIDSFSKNELIDRVREK